MEPGATGNLRVVRGAWPHDIAPDKRRRTIPHDDEHDLIHEMSIALGTGDRTFRSRLHLHDADLHSVVWCCRQAAARLDIAFRTLVTSTLFGSAVVCLNLDPVDQLDQLGWRRYQHRLSQVAAHDAHG